MRHEGGECIAAFKPQAVSIPTAGAALAYVWDGERISKVYEKSEVLFELVGSDQLTLCRGLSDLLVTSPSLRTH